jgi:Flp pilus assembly protein TadD
VGPEKILDSWKSVSRYLNLSVRTCQRLEREAGLPIHRIDSTPKARIYADRDEIDHWLKKTSHHRPRPLRRVWAMRAVLAAAPVLIALGVVAYRAVLFSRAPKTQPRPAAALAVLPVLNDTGDAGLDPFGGRLQRRLMVEVEGGAGAVTVISAPAVTETLETLHLTGHENPSESQVQAIMKRLDASHLLIGHFWKEDGAWILSYCLYRPKDPPAQAFVRSEGDAIGLAAAAAPGILGLLGRGADKEPAAGERGGAGSLEESGPFLNEAQAAEQAYVAECHPENLRKAIELYRQAVAARPASPAALFGLGHCYQNDYIFNGRDPESREAMAAAYREAFRLAPERPESLIGMGWLSLLGGRMAEADGWFRKARKLAAANPTVDYHLGVYLGHIGLAQKAVVFLTRAIDLGERSTRAYRMRAFYEALAGDARAAAADSAKLCEMNPTNAHMFTARAKILLRLSDLEGARRDLETAAVLAPDDEEVRLTQALVWAAEGRRDQALAELRRLPASAGSFETACIYALLGMTDEALEEIGSGLEKGRAMFLRLTYTSQLLNDPHDVIFSKLRSDPRFLRIVENLAAEQKRLQKRFGRF